MKKRLFLLLFYLTLIVLSVFAADKIIIPDGGGDYQNLTACLNALNNTRGDACIFNYTSGTNSTIFTLPKTYYNLSKSTSHVDTSGSIILNNVNNITIDCNFSIITGIEYSNGSGFFIHNSSNITIKNCNIKNYIITGIYVNDTNNITIDNFNLYNISYSSIYFDKTNNSFIRNINVSTNRKSWFELYSGLGYANFYGIYFKKSNSNIVNNFTLLGQGFVGTGNNAGSTGIRLESSTNNNFSNGTIDRFNWNSALFLYYDDTVNNTFIYINFTHNNNILDFSSGGKPMYNLINKSNFIWNNNIKIWEWGFPHGLNCSECIMDNIRDDQILIGINNTPNKTTGEFINFNVTFREVSFLNNLGDPNNYNISIYPEPTNLQYHKSGPYLFGNFTAERPGIYTIKINMTDNKSNVIFRNNHIYVNTTPNTITYYFAANRTMLHGQPNVIGRGSTDAIGMLLTIPEVDGVGFCSNWWAASPDEIPPSPFGVLVDYNFSMYHNQSGSSSTTMELGRYATYTGGGNPDHDAEARPLFYGREKPMWYNTTKISNYLIPIESQQDWFWLQFLEEDNSAGTLDPHVFTGPTNTSSINITYLYTYPKISNITNLNVRLLSATLIKDNSKNATIQLETNKYSLLDGDTSTNITIEMPVTSTTYKAYYDGTLCLSGGICNYSAIDNAITLQINVGSIHEIGIEEDIISVDTFPNIDFSMYLNDIKEVSCSASNTIGINKVELTIGSDVICRGTDSCSSDYKASDLGVKKMFCTATDDIGNAKQTLPIDITVRSTRSSDDGGSDPGPTTTITEDTQDITVDKGRIIMVKEGYSIEINNILGDSIDYTIYDSGKEVLKDNIKLKDSKDIDLDNDGNNDIRLRLNSIKLNKADITIERLGSSEDIIEEVTEEEKSLLWVWILVFILIIGVVGYFVYDKYKK